MLTLFASHANLNSSFRLTYLPHEAVAEVSKDKEPIGRGCVEFKWFESQLMSDSNELRVKWFGCQMIWDSNEFVVSWFEVQVSWLWIDLSFKWFGCQLMRASNDFGCLLNWTSSEVVVNWFEIQAIWLSIGLRFKWVGCQLIWDSKELVVNCIEIQVNLVVNRCVIRLILFVSWFEIQVSWLSIDLRLKWFGCQSIWDSKLFCETSFKIETLKLKNKAFLQDFLQNWNFEAQEQSFSARPPSKLKLWSSKIEAFVRDFLQKWSFDDQKRSIPARFLQTWNFEDQKRSISARLPSKLKLWSSKTKPFCETSFKIETLKLKNKAFLRDFLQNWHVDETLDRRIPIRFSDFASPVTATRNDHCKVTHPWHEICNPSTDSASKASNIDSTKREITAPATRNASFQTLFKSTTPANVFATLTNSCACHVFCNVAKSLRLPRETHFQRQKTSRAPGVLTILTSKSLSRAGVVQFWRSSTSKSPPKPSSFNDFHCPIALARRRGANFVDVNFQKCSEHASF